MIFLNDFVNQLPKVALRSHARDELRALVQRKGSTNAAAEALNMPEATLVQILDGGFVDAAETARMEERLSMLRSEHEQKEDGAR